MMSVIGIGIGIGVTSAIEDNEKAYMTTVGVLSVSNIKSFLINHKTFSFLILLSSCILITRNMFKFDI